MVPLQSQWPCPLNTGRSQQSQTIYRMHHLVDQGCEPVERADDGPDRRTGNAGVKCRGVELGVAQKRVWITRISTPCSSRWVAKLCRSVCGDTRLLIPAAWAARTTRPSWRADSGS